MHRVIFLLLVFPCLVVAAEEGLQVLQPNAALEDEIRTWQAEKAACYSTDDVAACLEGIVHDGTYIEGLTWNRREHPEACEALPTNRPNWSDDVPGEAMESCLFAGMESVGENDPSSARRFLADCLLEGEPEFNPYFDRYVIYTDQFICSVDYRDGRWGFTQITVRG